MKRRWARRPWLLDGCSACGCGLLAQLCSSPRARDRVAPSWTRSRSPVRRGERRLHLAPRARRRAAAAAVSSCGWRPARRNSAISFCSSEICVAPTCRRLELRASSDRRLHLGLERRDPGFLGRRSRPALRGLLAQLDDLVLQPRNLVSPTVIIVSARRGSERRLHVGLELGDRASRCGRGASATSASCAFAACTSASSSAIRAPRRRFRPRPRRRAAAPPAPPPRAARYGPSCRRLRARPRPRAPGRLAQPGVQLVQVLGEGVPLGDDLAQMRLELVNTRSRDGIGHCLGRPRLQRAHALGEGVPLSEDCLQLRLELRRAEPLRDRALPRSAGPAARSGSEQARSAQSGLPPAATRAPTRAQPLRDRRCLGQPGLQLVQVLSESVPLREDRLQLQLELVERAQRRRPVPACPPSACALRVAPPWTACRPALIPNSVLSRPPCCSASAFATAPCGDEAELDEHLAERSP